MAGKCLVIGDLNIDLVITEISGTPKLEAEIAAKNHFLDIGGSGGVFSAVLSELGINTYIISKIGNDYFGDFLKEKLEDYGVKINKIIIESDKETGVTISLSYTEDKIQVSSVELLKSSNIDDIVLEGLDNIEHVHFSSYYMMTGLHNGYLELIDNIKTQYSGITFSMDTNDDPENKWGKEIYNILPNIDIFLVNKKEALLITGENNIDDALIELSKIVKTVIIKLGRNGYIAKDLDGIYKGSAVKVNFKDSTAAGDNFDAGFIYGFMSGLGIKKSLEIANICGGKSVEYLGGVGPKEKFILIKKLIEKVILI